MANYTVNYCTNPAFQLGMTGYTAVSGANLILDTTLPLYGTKSLLVQTPGHVAGEGVITSPGLIPSAATCSESVFIQGTGTLVVNAVLNPGGSVIGSTTVTLTSSWQRVILGNLNATPGQSLYLIIQTASAQMASFWINGIQVEPESPPHPYCDGDQVGCFWTNGYGSPSFQPYQNPIAATANLVSQSNIVPVLAIGLIDTIPSASSSAHLNAPVVATTVPGPIAAVADFGIFQLTDPDPAQTYVGWNNSGLAPGTGGTYNRVWSTFYAPLDYPSSSGLLYSRAAYMAAGIQAANVPNNGTFNITDVQVEFLPITTGYAAPAPTAFDSPRNIHTIIKPNRLNFLTNPSIETSTAGWSGTGSATVSLDNTQSAPVSVMIDEVTYTAGTSSLKVTVNASGDGAQISIPNLIAGDTYIVSAYVSVKSAVPGSGFFDITMTCANGTTSVQSTGGTGYGTGQTYGGGFYGGVTPGVDLPGGQWFRIFTVFQATDSTVTLSFLGNVALDVTYPAVFWVDAVLLEAGQVLDTYFDGNFDGTNYFWEGATNLSRSYFYEQYKTKKQSVINILNQHLPLGISYATPLYNTPYTQ